MKLQLSKFHVRDIQFVDGQSRAAGVSDFCFDNAHIAGEIERNKRVRDFLQTLFLARGRLNPLSDDVPVTAFVGNFSGVQQL